MFPKCFVSNVFEPVYHRTIKILFFIKLAQVKQRFFVAIYNFLRLAHQPLQGRIGWSWAHVYRPYYFSLLLVAYLHAGRPRSGLKLSYVSHELIVAYWSRRFSTTIPHLFPPKPQKLWELFLLCLATIAPSNPTWQTIPLPLKSE